ncbi:hypothetical protein POPTR_010G214800v4 [Populus trichocarpa]|uniref:GST N-terminal domain-containing protein n=1 Tax=Populus trichocarpa TaxID=3694 RepID=A0A3N7FQL4_POPTR|nr:protein IN2-1 homolog B [Populus trichocarpa]KAI5575153.1 hypothetical protein BDE02_10G191800 [Populus trichocarpa]RQO97042.1 hypothetical protein POPTR_010G214800v4 [Populus trichocarpa]|eukprot:XP_024466227.1 protein IN2-1 homolog B [Populus trichocarpa]
MGKFGGNKKIYLGAKEVLSPALTSNPDPPPVFYGITSCAYSTCVLVHRVLGLPGIARLFRQDRPAWCKEKEYPTIKVPSLEHNNEVKGVSLDLIKCIDSHFDGLSFFPHDPAKKEFAEELFSCSGSFSKSINSTFKGEADEAGGYSLCSIY